MVPLGGCAGPRVKLFQGNHMTSLSFPRGPYDIIIIKWEKRCFTIYHTLLHIICMALTQLFVLSRWSNLATFLPLVRARVEYDQRVWRPLFCAGLLPACLR
jgi:hypothetical protein